MTMTQALVVFESMFGNTQVIARSIADGLAPRMRVELLVVGGPTHAFGMTRPETRQSASQQSERGLVSRGVGLREWLSMLPEDSQHVAVATFDTRIARPRLPGSAAAKAGKLLRRLGYRFVVPPTSFYVEGTTGPLVGGESERARRWGEELAAAIGAPRGVVGQS